MTSTSHSDLLRRHAEEIAALKRTIERQARVVEAARAHRAKSFMYNEEREWAIMKALDDLDGIVRDEE